MVKRLEYDIVTDPSKGIAGLKQFAGAAKKAMKEVDESLEDTTTSAQKVAKALSGLAEELESEMKGAARAADALADALGPELTGRANVDSIVADLNKMGLTFDEITADADALAASLKDLDRVQMAGPVQAMQQMEDSTKRAKGSVDEIGNSADQSRSVLANMVGNATQDLGALGGVAGTAGVALGQLGEYATEGGIQLGNLAKVAGPMAGLALATAAVSSHMEGIAAEKAFRSQLVDRFADSLRDAETVAQELLDTLQETNAIDFSARGGGFLDLGRETKNLLPFIEELGLTWDQVIGDITDPQAKKRINDMTGEMVFQGDEAEHLAVVWNDYADGIDQYGDAWRTANAEQEIGKRLQAQAAEAGVQSAEAIERQVRALKDWEAEQRQLKVDKIMENAQALQDWAVEQEEATRAAEDFAVALAGTQTEVDDLGSAFAGMERRGDALSNIFDLGDAPLDALGQIHDVTEGVRDLAEFIKEEGVPDIFDPADVDAGPFLDKLASLRGPIQEQITAAFAGGGPEAAKKTAATWVQNVYDALGGALTKDQITTLLGLDNLEATIGVALDASDLALAQQSLALLVGLKGENPWTASIALQLAAGEITPQAAQELINEKLQGAGVEIPAGLGPVANTATVIRDAQREANRNPVTIPVVFRPATGQGQYGPAYQDAGGTTPPAGGIAGERGPEIIDGRYLTVGPTYVPPGTRVTSRKRTARILKSRGHRGLKPYDSGGTVMSTPVTNVTVHLPAGTNGADVVRQVKRWQRRNGTLV